MELESDQLLILDIKFKRRSNFKNVPGIEKTKSIISLISYSKHENAARQSKDFATKVRQKLCEIRDEHKDSPYYIKSFKIHR